MMFFDESVEIEERVCCSDIEMIGRDNQNDDGNDNEMMNSQETLAKP